MHTLLRDIITNQAITTEFQTIFDITDQSIVGFEALSRGPQDSPLYAPERLFETAIQCGYLYELDILCRRLAIERFVAQALPGLLFLNVSPMILANPKYPLGETIQLVEKAGLKGQQVVIEISEQYPIFSVGLLQSALQRYRQYGFKVAIDNLGCGYHGLKNWTSLQPDIVKIDRSLIENCHQDLVKKTFLDTLFKLGTLTNVKIIVQGLQEPQEFALLSELGMTCAQGYFLAEPALNPPAIFPAIAKISKTCYQPSSPSNTIKPLVTYPLTCDIKTKAGTLYKLLVANPKIQCVPVLCQQKPVGLVSRHQLMERFSDTYSHALFDSRNIDVFMEDAPVILDHNTSLDQASFFITRCNDEQFSQYFIITENEQYLGLASSRELLRQITEAKIENARYANPLTLLPGNVPIDREIDRLLAAKQPFELAYVDIDHFKPFNDVYGYAKGDQLITLVAQILRVHCHSEQTFVGHIGGDDFIILFSQTTSNLTCQRILADFEQQSLAFFDQQAIENGGYVATSRSGVTHLFPLVSISIGVVAPPINQCTSHHEVSLMASEAKKQAKKQEGNSLFYCRRSDFVTKTGLSELALA